MPGFGGPLLPVLRPSIPVVFACSYSFEIAVGQILICKNAILSRVGLN
jgi:hypothetical protein